MARSWISTTTFRFLSTLSLRRATDGLFFVVGRNGISIHALLAESDGKIPANIMLHFDFYPRSPCGERHTLEPYQHCSVQFLSTLSLRRATACTFAPAGKVGHFYPRSPCGERLTVYGDRIKTSKISIHALLAESDFGGYFIKERIKIFLSTLSLRRATARGRING